MKLLLERIFTCSKYTIGKLYAINGDDKEYICDTIEDTDRGLKKDMPLQTIKNKKVYAETAIPLGEYKITMNVKSPSFSKKTYYSRFCDGYLPRLLNVPGFDGILIHRGSTAEHSAGCLIVGFNKIKGQVIDSQIAFEKLMNNYLLPCKKSNESIEIEIIKKILK